MELINMAKIIFFGLCLVSVNIFSKDDINYIITIEIDINRNYDNKNIIHYLKSFDE